MINGKKVLALIPARGGSKGLPGKNIMILNNRPLVGWPIAAAKGSKYVDRVIVTTDDKQIAQIAAEQGADVPFLRPAELATDSSHRTGVIKHALDFCHSQGEDFEYLVFLEPTSPLTEAEDVDSALAKLVASRDIADSIVGVAKLESGHPLFNVLINDKGLIRPYSGRDFGESFRRQDIPDVYFFEGTLYISVVGVFLEKEFYHSRTLPYVVPKWKSLEVDDIVDFVCIEAIMKNLSKIKGSER